MGKGNRNRLDRTDVVKEPKKAAPKVKKQRKPMAKAAKVTIACVLAFLIVAGIVVGSLWSNGVFRSRTPLVESKNGQYDLTKASSAYLLWESQINYMISLYSSWGYLTESNALSIYANLLTNYRTEFTTPSSLRKALEESADSLTGYVAVCDIADTFGIELTKEEIKTAKANALTSLDTWVNIANNVAMSKLSSGSAVSVDDGKGGTKEVTYSQKYYNKDICSNGSDFLKKYVGSYVTKQDVQDAAVIAALYNKVLTTKNEQVEEALIVNNVIDKAQLEAYRDSNPEDYFSTDYIEYVTEDKDLKEQIENASDAKTVKELIARAVADKAYKAFYNKYASGANAAAEALYEKITSETTLTKDNLTGADYGMEFRGPAKKDALTDPTAVKTWVSDSSRKAGDKETIAVTDDGIYVVVFIEKTTDSSENDLYSYAIKKFDLVDAPASFKDSETFKQDIINSVLINLDLIEETDDIKEVYKSDTKPADDDSKDTKTRIETAVSILKEVKSEVSTATTTKNEQFTKFTDEDFNDDNKEKDLLEKFLFGKSFADKDWAKEAESYVEEKTEGEGEDAKTTYTIYSVITPMKLDDDKVIWGGYIKFTGSDRDTEAEAAKEKLVGKSGAELWRALQELDATVDYGFESSDLTDMTALSEWMLSDDRSSGEIGIVKGTETETVDSSVTTTEVTYVAVVMEKTECWLASAMSASINQTIEDWLEECRKDYKLNTAIIDALPTEATTEAATAAEK